MARHQELKEVEEAKESNAITPNNSSNVSVGKGKASSYLMSAAKTVAVPTDASSELATGYVNLGYVSEDGITNTKETDSTDFKDLNGDVVMTTISSRKETFKFKLIETNLAALKEYYGQGNVTQVNVPAQTPTHTLTTVKSNSVAYDERRYVMDFALTGGRKMRKVIPLGRVSELGDEVYASGELIGYEITITAEPDASGNTAYTYIEEPLPAE